MKSRTLLWLMFMGLFAGFGNLAIGQDYTYELTVFSLSEKEQSFDIEIISKTSPSLDPIKITLSNQTTPFKKALETGEHKVTVVHPEGRGRIESKITGIVDGESKGWASSDERKATLKAGPGGRYSASK